MPSNDGPGALTLCVPAYYQATRHSYEIGRRTASQVAHLGFQRARVPTRTGPGRRGDAVRGSSPRDGASRYALGWRRLAPPPVQGSSATALSEVAGGGDRRTR